MKSPFPGMDPYLESYWGDVHTRLMVYASNQINAQLPDELQARVRKVWAWRLKTRRGAPSIPMFASWRNEAHGQAKAAGDGGDRCRRALRVVTGG